MSDSAAALRPLVDEMVRVLAPLIDAAARPDRFKQILADLGWTTASIPAPLSDLASAGAAVIDAVLQSSDNVATLDLMAGIGGLFDAIERIRSAPDSAFPGDVDITTFKQTIGRDLLDYCVVEYALSDRFKVGRVLKLAGIVQLIETPASGLRRAHLHRRVDWSRIGTLLTDPITGFREAYNWNASAPRLTHVIDDVASVLEAFGFDYSYCRLTPAQLAFANAGATQPVAEYLGIALDLGEALGVQPGDEATLRFFVRAATATRGQAIAIAPFARLSAMATDATGDAIAFSIEGDAELAQGAAITFGPSFVPTLEAFGSSSPQPSKLALALRIPPPPDEPERVLIGTADGSRLSLHTVTLSGGATLVGASGLDAFVELLLDRLRVVVKSDDADSFLAGLLGRDGLSAELSLGIRLSSASGFHLSGSGGLEASVPVDVQLGPVKFQSISIALVPRANGVALSVGAAMRGAIGPVTAVTEGVGFALTMDFLDPPTGNLGPIDVGFGFKPPSGIGLSIDAGGVSGGGFLFHDPVQSLYAGVMQLSFSGTLMLTAFGLIATRLPDGSRGYSLIVFITAQDFKPIPLGMGFTLLGIGGMVAVNRTFDQDVLRQGLKNDTLGTLLFPRDPVGNAPALIRSLAAAFPANSGSYLLGILAKIGWFTPTLVLFELALILEFGSRKRLLVLGRISSILPSADNDLIRLVLDAIGVIDFDQSTASIDAVLVDSRLARAYALTGAMALRANWGSGPGSSFVLAIGGLHPQFPPPADLPKLDRIAIALSSGSNPRLVCEAYFAITANTVQFGAAASLYAAAYGFSVEGDIGYDVLLQIAPLHFIADFSAKLQLKHGSTNLFSVSLDGELEGPRPLRVSGNASFEIFWCSFSIRFDATLIDGETPPPPPSVDLTGQLTQALRAPTSWSMQTPLAHGVALKKLAPADTLVLDPLGLLVVKQQVAPLNTSRDIDLYGGAPVAGARRFQLAASLQGDGQGTRPIGAPFAPAQFFAMSDDDKLAAPSFETMDAGLVIGDGAVRFDEIVAAPLAYDSIVVDTMPQPSTRPNRYTLLSGLLIRQSRSGSAAKAPTRRIGPARYAQAGASPAATLNPIAWTIQPLADGTPPALDPKLNTWSEYRATLASLNRPQASWQMVPAHELVTA